VIFFTLSLVYEHHVYPYKLYYVSTYTLHSGFLNISM